GNGGGNTTPTAATAPTGTTQAVSITTDSSGQFTFSPKSVTISVGTTVIWKNTTQTPHTATSSDGKSFNSGDSTPIAPGTTFSFKFSHAGTFAYHCDFHPYMTATIVVK
ncbi:MAG TPA: amidase, partial [Ktedonobacter sp.]|nr:amidase [Ktedonobacter sp.]